MVLVQGWYSSCNGSDILLPQGPLPTVTNSLSLQPIVSDVMQCNGKEDKRKRDKEVKRDNWKRTRTGDMVKRKIHQPLIFSYLSDVNENAEGITFYMKKMRQMQ